MSFDAGASHEESIASFDTFVQIVDGQAAISIRGKSILLVTGDSMVIPAHAPLSVKSNRRFKMMLTVIKSGYE